MNLIQSDEDNDCEQLIRLQKSVPECSLMTDGYHSQKKKYYFCPCDPDCQTPLCLSCVQDCHREHWGKKTLEELITDKRSALCSCGLRNHLLPEDGLGSDFVYQEQCLFIEWSITSKLDVYYQHEDDEEKCLCIFCYNLCMNQPQHYMRMEDPSIIRTTRCCCKHTDYLKIFEQMQEIAKNSITVFDELIGIQLLNMTVMSKKSFENSFHKMLTTLANLEASLSVEGKSDFDFSVFINNSPFMKAIETIYNISLNYKDMVYSNNVIDCSNYIFPLLQKKFNYKNQENVWLFKRNVLGMYYRLNFCRDFEVLPVLNVNDFANMNPFQRAAYSEYISLYPNLVDKYIKNKNKDNCTYVDMLLRIIEKYKKIKYKNSYSYEILRNVFAQCGKIIRFNKLTNEQCMKFYALIDEIIYNSINNKDINILTGLEQMKMLYKMVKAILYLAYYYNDEVLFKFLRGEITLSQVSFFHLNSETAKMIYKNTTHILLYCRTIQNCCCSDKESEENMQLLAEKLTDTDSEMKIAKIKAQITKMQNRIMFLTNDITSLTLNYPDAYLFGLQRLLKKNQELFWNFINNNFKGRDEALLNEFNDLCKDTEKIYKLFYNFEMNIEQLERELIHKIQRFFLAIENEDFMPTFEITDQSEFVSKKKADGLSKSLFGRKKTNMFQNFVNKVKQRAGDRDENIQILMNKTPLVLTMLKSLKIIIPIGLNDDLNVLNRTYFKELFRFLGYYVKDSTDNCLMILTEKVLKGFLLINEDYIATFINFLYYCVSLLLKTNASISKNNVLFKVLEELIKRINGKSELVESFSKLLSIINRYSKINYLHGEHTLNKMRRTVKKLYLENPTFKKFKNCLLPDHENEVDLSDVSSENSNDENEKKEENEEENEDKSKNSKPSKNSKLSKNSKTSKNSKNSKNKKDNKKEESNDNNEDEDDEEEKESIMGKKRKKNIKIMKDNDYRTLAELITVRATIEGYDIGTLTVLFTKFLKIVNFLFDGNSALNESEFLRQIFTKEQLPTILKDLTLHLPLRVELLKFFRMTYIDVIIDTTLVNHYIDIFAGDVINDLNSNTSNFVFFHNLLRVKDRELNMNIDSSLLIYELKHFEEIIQQGGKDVPNKKYAYYFENGIILPLHVFINKYISIIYNLDGLQYIKLYEIVVFFLELKKTVSQLNNKQKSEMLEGLFGNDEKSQFVKMVEKMGEDKIKEITDDIETLKDKNFEILNYKKIYSFFEKHIKGFINCPESKYLKDVFSKKNKMYTEEEIQEKREKCQEDGLLKTHFEQILFDIIIKYENDKTEFVESSLCQNLAEKNVLYDATYRLILLRPMWYLINSEKLYLKYRRQNLWNVFKLLQYDTNGTQDDILSLIHADNAKVKNKVTIHNSPKRNKKNKEKEKEKEDYKRTINFNYLTDLFITNLLSIVFESCNPSASSDNEDYTICYMIIKIMKYMCEDHNTQFQTIFFNDVQIDYSGGTLNMFELMMCVLGKITVLAKWDSVDFDQDENSISYFYEIFFAMIEFSIEMIQGTTRENLNTIISVEGRENEKSYFYKFLKLVKPIILNDKNDSEIVYSVRLDIMNFIAAFVEEKKTPEKIITLLANLYNPLAIFECIVDILKKLYLKSIGQNEGIRNTNSIEFDADKCKYFIEKYFSDSEFSQNQEFELSNRMYNYVRQLATNNIKDAKNIIDSINLYTEAQLIEYREKQNSKKEQDEDSQAIMMIDPKYCQNYFAVKFFEAITRTVYIQGEEKRPEIVIFTLEPTVLYLSMNTKNNFYKTVPRDTRSSKLFTLMEYTTYFFIEINHNKDRLSKSKILQLLNNVKFSYLDVTIYLIDVVINLIIYSVITSDEAEDNYQHTYNCIFYPAVIQLVITSISILMWIISKFTLYFVIEKEKYYDRNRKNKEEPLSLFEYLKIIVLYTILNQTEMVNFLWDLIFSILGLHSSKNIYVYSIQLIIIVNINSTLQNIVKAIVMRYDQLLTSLLFMLIAVYIFSAIAFFLLSKDFIHELEGNIENTCGSLFYCFMTHLEFGLRTDGGIGDFINKISFNDDPAYFMGMFFYQFIFFVILIVIILAVIGGSIIDTFAELREKSQQDLNDMKNICFICNGTRNDIEKEGENFDDHVNKKHDLWTYVDYMIGLKFVDPQETNAINSFVIEKLEQKKISWFPSFSPLDELQSSNQGNDGDDNKKGDEGGD